MIGRCLAVAALLGIAAPATATDMRPLTPQIVNLVRTALPSECGNRATYEFVSNNTVGWGGIADMQRCRVALDPFFNASSYAYCVLVAHEWGHLAGLPHSEDPANFMYTGLSGSFAPCEQAPLPALTEQDASLPFAAWFTGEYDYACVKRTRLIADCDLEFASGRIVRLVAWQTIYGPKAKIKRNRTRQVVRRERARSGD